MLTKMSNMNNNQLVVNNNNNNNNSSNSNYSIEAIRDGLRAPPAASGAHPPPPLPLKVSGRNPSAAGGSRTDRQRAARDPKATESGESFKCGPYKSVPTPKSVTATPGPTTPATSGPGNPPPPPPYRQPPVPVDSSSTCSSSSSSSSATASTTVPVHHQSDSRALDGHALLAYSSKFPIERELVVTTGDKIAEVGRIETQQQQQQQQPQPSNHEAASTEMAPTVPSNQNGWNDDRWNRLPGDGLAVGHPSVHQHPHQHYGTEPPTRDAGHVHAVHPLANSGGGEEMRPASYVPMHIHYHTGWANGVAAGGVFRHENNYVAMNFDHHQRHLGAADNPSASFDSIQSTERRLDPFAPPPASLSQYEIRVDSSDRPSTVTVAPWNGEAADTSTFDRLRDTCTKMFLRDGPLRGSSQFALSPTLPRALEHLTIETDEPAKNEAESAAAADDPDVKNEGDSGAKSGSMRKKLAGKTYHSLKDMFTNKLAAKLAKNRSQSSQETAETAADSAPAAGARPPVTTESIHSINQRIHSQIASHQNQQVWGSYGRSKAESAGGPLSDVDASALAKLTLSATAADHATPNSPFSLRHKPSVTFRMDLNECQYSSVENGTESAAFGPYGRTSQGQVILYDDTMHFPQQQQQQQQQQVQPPQQPLHKEVKYGELDSSVSSITSGPAAQKPSGRNFAYSDYDVPPSKGRLDTTLSPVEGLSSGHQSAGSTSDLDKRSGQSVSTSDSGLGIGGSAPEAGRNRTVPYQGVLLDTSTETDVFSSRQSAIQNEWTEAADREVKNAMETQRHHYGRLDTSGEQRVDGLHSTTPPLPPLSPESSPKPTPKLQHKFSNRYRRFNPSVPPTAGHLSRSDRDSKPDLLEPTNNSSNLGQRTSSSAANGIGNNHKSHSSKSGANAASTGTSSALVTRTAKETGALLNKSTSSGALAEVSARSKRRHHHDEPKTSKSHHHPSASKSRSSKVHPLTALQEALDLGDITSTTGLDLDVDSDSDCSQSESQSDDDDLSTTLDVTNDSRTIRRQLEGLESMYSEVLKALHKKSRTGTGLAASSSDYKLSKRRMYGSVSSLPSSVCSRPVYRDRRRTDERRSRPNASKETKKVNKRFQRLESHVVTLARSVAHLSSEMRTQHLMIQEMETIRNEIAQLRLHPFRMSAAHATGASPSGYGRSSRHYRNLDRDSCWQGAVPALTDPSRVKKLTSFFGDEPPLLRIFLKKLGYEKYAPLFDQEKIGMIELPYLTEERLHKMGIPMGPRIRILQEAQLTQSRPESLNVYGIV